MFVDSGKLHDSTNKRNTWYRDRIVIARVRGSTQKERTKYKIQHYNTDTKGFAIRKINNQRSSSILARNVLNKIIIMNPDVTDATVVLLRTLFRRWKTKDRNEFPLDTGFFDRSNLQMVIFFKGFTKKQ